MSTLDLNDLSTGANPGITAAVGNSLAQAGAVCLEDQGHGPGVQLDSRGQAVNHYHLDWPKVSAQARRSWNDLEEATEFGAAGIAVLLVNRELGFMVVARSRKGTGFDYFLGHAGLLDSSNLGPSTPAHLGSFLDDDDITVTGRMEVSGILHGNNSVIRARVDQKLEQLDRSSGLGIPAYAIVVEFGQPVAEVREK